MIRRTLTALALAAGLFAASAAFAQEARVEPPAGPETAAAHMHDDWDAILRAHVRADRVDYVGLAGRDLGKLDRYLLRLAAVNADTLAAPDRVAFWLNLYNATVVRAVCARWHEGWRPDADAFALFKAPIVRMKAGEYTLDMLEHQVIRRRMSDPRIHAALCCAAVSCPPLQPRAYRGATVDSLLEVDMRSFVMDRTRNQFDPATRTARLSQVFEWYVRDFGGEEGRAVILEAFSGLDTKGWTVKYLPYDWSLNIVAPAAAPAAAGKPGKGKKK